MKIERVEEVSQLFSELSTGDVFKIAGGSNVYMKLNDMDRAADLENGYTYALSPGCCVIVDKNATIKTCL